MRPIYAPTAAYGHFGRTDLDLPWERTDRADKLKAAAGHLSPLPVPGPAGNHSRHRRHPSMSPRAATTAPRRPSAVASVLVMLVCPTSTD
ncbi:MAG: hypothetical protein PGN29_08475, partial [Gordonia paraffinivorans]